MKRQPTDRSPIDYKNPKVRREILTRQRRDIWTPEQVESLARHFRLRPGMKVLDVGCGHSYALRTWGRYCLPGGELVGLDREKSLLATALRLCRREGIAGSCRFVEGSAYELPFVDGSFDFTLAHVVFCHLAEPEAALDEMLRVTRPGGCVAVFDNASAGGPAGGWNNLRRPTLEQRLFDHEMYLRMHNGARRLRQADFDVGCRLPGWFEQRGLRDVDARSNERVRWLAPPYRSPAQRTLLRSTRERVRDFKPGEYTDQSWLDQVRAGGAGETAIRRCRRGSRRDRERWARAVRAGTLAFAYAGQFWCVWGFKPGKQRG